MSLLGAFGDVEATVEDVVADENTCVTWYSFRGTQQGDLLADELTGRTVESQAVSNVHVEDGLVVEEGDVTDVFATLQQLGVVDVPAR